MSRNGQQIVQLHRITFDTELLAKICEVPQRAEVALQRRRERHEPGAANLLTDGELREPGSAPTVSAYPCIGRRFLSLRSWGRPPLPWDIADRVYAELAAQPIASVGVTGSLCPSIVTAVGYARPQRRINTFAFWSRWSEGEGWNHVLDDSPGMEKTHPWSNPYVPVHWDIWDGATPFFDSEALFIDHPLAAKHQLPIHRRVRMIGCRARIPFGK